MAGTNQKSLNSRWQGAGVTMHWGKGAGADHDVDIDLVDGNSVPIKPGDEIVMAVHRTAGVFTTNLLAEIIISSEGHIQNDTTDTTADEVEVLWLHPEQ